MARPAILPIRGINVDIDVFSNKSSLILFWLFVQNNNLYDNGFSINEISRKVEISVGLVHKVIKQLEYTGIVKSEGLRTGKKFYLEHPEKLLLSWIQEYNLVRKTSSKGFAALNFVNLNHEKYGLIPALHTASEQIFHLKTTNLRLKEFYLQDWSKLSRLVDSLSLMEMDRGYEILLIKPYYSALLAKFKSNEDSRIWNDAFSLLTILDLCHFPIRGIEQAETLFRKSVFKSICPWSDIERAIG